jgi:HK97 family phage portal protein
VWPNLDCCGGVPCVGAVGLVRGGVVSAGCWCVDGPESEAQEQMIGRLLEMRTAGEERAVRDPKWGRWAAGNDLVPSIQAPSTEAAMGLLCVYGCVQLISDSIATLPIDVLDGRDPVATPAWLSDQAATDRVDLFGSMLTSLLLEGNAIAAIGRNDRGQVVTVDVLDPRRVIVEADGPDSFTFKIDHVVFPGEMLMIRGLMMPGRIRGVSPVEMARQSVGLGLGAQDQAARFYTQGAITPGVIHSKSDLSVEQMREIRDQWLASHGGTSKSHLPVVLTGDTSWQSISMTAEQAQFLDSRKYSDSQIAGQMFLVDPSMIGIALTGTTLTYQNLEQRGHHLVRHSLLRWIVRLERGLSRLLPDGQHLKFNVNGLMRGDLNSRYASYETAARINGLLGAPLLSVQEMRDLEDLGPMIDAGLTGGAANV